MIKFSVNGITPCVFDAGEGVTLHFKRMTKKKRMLYLFETGAIEKVRPLTEEELKLPKEEQQKIIMESFDVSEIVKMSEAEMNLLENHLVDVQGLTDHETGEIVSHETLKKTPGLLRQFLEHVEEEAEGWKDWKEAYFSGSEKKSE